MKSGLKLIIVILVLLGASGCGLFLFTTTMVAAGVAGTGYVAYKSGEAVVSTTGKAVSGTAEGVQDVLFYNNAMESTYPADVRTLQREAREALGDLGFKAITGRADASYGNLEAMTTRQQKVELTFKPDSASRTRVRIKVGATGDKQVESLIWTRTVERLQGRAPQA